MPAPFAFVGRARERVGPVILAIVMLATVALAAGGVWLMWQGADRRRGLLMLIVALVLLGNVLIWAWPARTPVPGEGVMAG